MNKKLKGVPAVILKESFTRIGLSIVTFVLFGVVLFSSKEIYFALPGLIIFGFLALTGVKLLYNGIYGNYVHIQGRCTEIETKGFLKRIRGAFISFEDKQVKLVFKKRIKQLRVGDTITVYLSTKTPVYENDGILAVYEYYGIEIKKEVAI